MKITTRTSILGSLCFVIAAGWSTSVYSAANCCDVRWVPCYSTSTSCVSCTVCGGEYYQAANYTKECYAVEDGWDECIVTTGGSSGYCWVWTNCFDLVEQPCGTGFMCDYDSWIYGGSTNSGHGLIGSCP